MSEGLRLQKNQSLKRQKQRQPHAKPGSKKISSATTRAASSITPAFVDRLAPQQQSTISAQVIKTASLINSPKQLVFQGTINKIPVTFLLDGGADHSILSQQFAARNGIVIRPLDQPISTKFANGTSETIKFATDPLQLQCQGHRSCLQPLVSTDASFDLLVGLDWLSAHNPRVNWDSGSLNVSDEDCSYVWKSVNSDAEHHTDSLTILLCTARQVRAHPAENENYANYVFTISQATEDKPPPPLAPAVQSLLQEFPEVQQEPTSLPPNRSYQHAIPLMEGAQPVRESPYAYNP